MAHDVAEVNAKEVPELRLHGENPSDVKVWGSNIGFAHGVGGGVDHVGSCFLGGGGSVFDGGRVGRYDEDRAVDVEILGVVLPLSPQSVVLGSQQRSSHV